MFGWATKGALQARPAKWALVIVLDREHPVAYQSILPVYASDERFRH